MPNTQPWHSTLATDRPLSHDDTHCPEGQAIEVKDRRSGDGGRDPCLYCAGLLIEPLRATLPPSALAAVAVIEEVAARSRLEDLRGRAAPRGGVGCTVTLRATAQSDEAAPPDNARLVRAEGLS